MPRYYPNSGISDCWGSAGDVTFYHRDGICFFKKKPVMEFAGTPGQLEQAGIVGPANGSKPRDAKIFDMAELEALLQELGVE